MKKIIRDYAIIYIDNKGVTLKETDYTTQEMISDYYKESGFLQWNFYLIIPEEVLSPDDNKEDIEKNDIYTRKYVINKNDIHLFISKRFPVRGEKSGTIELVKRDSWKETTDVIDKNKNTKFLEHDFYPSWYRDNSSLYSLDQMDILRAKLINYPNMQAVFYTHITNEYYLAEKKFKRFLNNKEDDR